MFSFIAAYRPFVNPGQTSVSVRIIILNQKSLNNGNYVLFHIKGGDAYTIAELYRGFLPKHQRFYKKRSDADVRSL